jgi:hypothetical protein
MLSIANRTLEQAAMVSAERKKNRRQDAGATEEKHREHYKTISRLYRQFLWE